MNSSIALVILIILLLPFKSYSQDKNYKKLEEVEKKLQYNELTYLELVKIEKALNQGLYKLKKNIKKYKKSIAKGFIQRNKLKKNIIYGNKELKALEQYKSHLKKNKSLIINNFIYLTYKNDSSKLLKQATRNILITINSIEETNKLALLELNNILKVSKLSLNKLNSSLNNIEFALNSRSNEMEGLIGETIITAIEKEENKLQKSKIKKEVNAIKSLIQEFESTRRKKKPLVSFNFSKLKDILPVGKIDIKSIKTDKLKTGILLSLKNDSILKAPKNSLVVYADFFKGYGKMVILDLGSNYHLIFSGLNNINCKTGDWLEKGSTIGDININNNEIVYMEFRFKGKTINPLNWANS